ncbi:SAM-dependent methyltransferase [Streptomyces virginiae]|uniref:SAM-dependent methyltransferase n=1 Tax=Streptomyces virginiae TaxID=1961 RepID=UPI00352E53DA
MSHADEGLPSAVRLGTHNPHEVDQNVARAVRNAFPRQPTAARINREHHLLITDAFAQRGITQILDLGCGHPANGQHGAADPLLPEHSRELQSNVSPPCSPWPPMNSAASMKCDDA